SALSGCPGDRGAARGVRARRRGAWCRVRCASSVAVVARSRRRNSRGCGDSGILAPTLLPALAPTLGGGRSVGRRATRAGGAGSPMGTVRRRLSRCRVDAGPASAALPDTAGSVVELEVRGEPFRLRAAARARAAHAAGAGRDILRMGGGARAVLREPPL